MGNGSEDGIAKMLIHLRVSCEVKIWIDGQSLIKRAKETSLSFSLSLCRSSCRDDLCGLGGRSSRMSQQLRHMSAQMQHQQQQQQQQQQQRNGGKAGPSTNGDGIGVDGAAEVAEATAPSKKAPPPGDESFHISIDGTSEAVTALLGRNKDNYVLNFEGN